MPHPFDRYEPFTDVAALKEISKKPLRRCIRVNLLKSSVDEFASWAKAEGWSIAPVPWCAEGFFIDRDDRSVPLGKDLLHLLGHTYIQEASSMLPVELLHPQPGEAILDMSAAPGSKTTQIAAKMQGRGVLVANDVQQKRLWTLASNLQRCGVRNVVVIEKVGQWFAKHMCERFDRILVDAPCSAQGTVRKDPDALTYCSVENIEKLKRLQVQILESAIHATKVGGRIVYSTCTLTPEENEGVVAQILSKFSDQVIPLDIGLGKNSDWMKKSLLDSFIVQKNLRAEGIISTPEFPAHRLWPHTFDSEGFFAAVLEKRAPTNSGIDVDRIPLRERPLASNEQRSIVRELEGWYGTSFLDEDERLFETTKQIFVTTRDVAEFPLPLRNVLLGLPFGKSTKHGFPRLSHEIAVLKGAQAKNAVFPIDVSQWEELLKGHDLSVSTLTQENGDVLFSLERNGRKFIVGRGLLKDGTVFNRLPRDLVQRHS